MTGRYHAPPDQLQQYKRLACPFAKSDPDKYMRIAACRTTEGFKELRELNEHIWRKHTPFYRCGFCPDRWSISTARGKVTQKKEQHWETCEGRRRGTPYFSKFDEDGTELLDGDQQQRFAETKSIRRNHDKLKALYEACEKPPPDSYYVPDALPEFQPQVTYSRTATRTTTSRRVQQPDNHGSEFLTGFVPPRPEGHHRQQRRRPTAHNVSRSDAQVSRGDYEVSGANRQPDTDSGYVSMPRDDGDASELSLADCFPSHQPGGAYQYIYASSHARSYEGIGNHAAAAATTSSGHLTNHGEEFDQLYHRCFDHSVVDPSLSSLYNDASSSTGNSQALLGLIPGPGAGDAEGSLNIWEYTNLDAEFLEHSGSQSLE